MSKQDQRFKKIMSAFVNSYAITMALREHYINNVAPLLGIDKNELKKQIDELHKKFFNEFQSLLDE